MKKMNYFLTIAMALLFSGNAVAQPEIQPLVLKSFSHKAASAGVTAHPMVVDAQGNYFLGGGFQEKITLANHEFEGIDSPSAFVVKKDPSGKELWAMANKGTSTLQALRILPNGNLMVVLSLYDKLELASTAGETWDFVAPSGDNVSNLAILLFDAEGKLAVGKVLAGSDEYATFMIAPPTINWVDDAVDATGDKTVFSIMAHSPFTVKDLKNSTAEGTKYMLDGLSILGGFAHQYLSSAMYFLCDWSTGTVKLLGKVHAAKGHYNEEEDNPYAMGSKVEPQAFFWDKEQNLVLSLYARGYVTYDFTSASAAGVLDSLDCGAKAAGEGLQYSRLLFLKLSTTGELQFAKSWKLNSEQSSVFASVHSIMLTEDEKSLLLLGGYQCPLLDAETDTPLFSATEDYTDFFFATLDYQTGTYSEAKPFGVKLPPASALTLSNLPSPQYVKAEKEIYYSFPFTGTIEVGNSEFTALSEINSKATNLNSMLVHARWNDALQLPEAVMGYPLLSDSSAAVSSLYVAPNTGILSLSGCFSTLNAEGFSFMETKAGEEKGINYFEATLERTPSLLTVAILPSADAGKLTVQIDQEQPVVFQGKPEEYPELEVRSAQKMVTLTAEPAADFALDKIELNGVSVENGKPVELPDATAYTVNVTFKKSEPAPDPNPDPNPDPQPQPQPSPTAVESSLLSGAYVLQNPFSGVVSVEGITSSKVHYTLLNLQGQVVGQGETLVNGRLGITVPASLKGVCILRLTDDEGLSRIVKLIAQ